MQADKVCSTVCSQLRDQVTQEISEALGSCTLFTNKGFAGAYLPYAGSFSLTAKGLMLVRLSGINALNIEPNMHKMHINTASGEFFSTDTLCFMFELL